MRVSRGYLGIVADAQQHGSEREPARSVERRGRINGIIEGRPGKIVGQQVQILVAEIHSRLYHMTPPDQRPVITIFVGGLNFSQRVAEGILSEALKVVPRSVEARRSKIDGVARSALYA